MKSTRESEGSMEQSGNENSKISHTPGPWHIAGTGKDFGIYSGTLVTDEKTGRQHYRGTDQVLPFFDCDLKHGMHGKRHMADAKLITAAPDMLKSLKDIQVKAERQRMQLSGLLDLLPENHALRTAITENTLIINATVSAIAKAIG